MSSGNALVQLSNNRVIRKKDFIVVLDGSNTIEEVCDDLAISSEELKDICQRSTRCKDAYVGLLARNKETLENGEPKDETARYKRSKTEPLDEYSSGSHRSVITRADMPVAIRALFDLLGEQRFIELVREIREL